MSKRVLIIGAGFFGAVCARQLSDAGHACTVIEKRSHIGGNCYTRHRKDIQRFSDFNHFSYRPRVFHRGKIYSFPINLLTLYQVFGVTTPEEAQKKARDGASADCAPSQP